VVHLADGEPDLAATYRAIAAMDREFEKWGWKSPRDFAQLDKIASLLRDLGFIFATRDVLESALSGLAYQNMPLEPGLYEVTTVYRRLAHGLRFLLWPTLVVSYSDALQHPRSLVDLLCSFLSIQPEISLRARAASFIQPGKHSYRLFDAAPGDPPALIAEEDLRMDAEFLASDVGKRYGAEYLRYFDMLMAETRAAAQKLGSIVGRGEKADLTSEFAGQLCRLLLSLPQEDFPMAQSHCEAIEASLRDRASNERFLAAFMELLDSLASSACSAKARLDGRGSHTGFTDFKRVYYVLEVLIRIREAVRRALQVAKFQSTP
jgi:hypothetical protein